MSLLSHDSSESTLAAADTPAKLYQHTNGLVRNPNLKGCSTVPGCGDPPDARHTMLLSIMQSFLPPVELARYSNDSRSRICGVWVEALPPLNHRDPSAAVSLAIQCLALCIANMREHSHTTFTTLMEAYVAAAGGLNRELQNTQSEVGGRDEHVAAVMCLCMTDMIMPHKGTDWWHHSDGLSKLLQLSPPQSYASGSRHKLFVGFRPLLVIQAFASRKPTFLAHDEWKVRPFSEEQASPIQQLPSNAAELPSILAQVDAA